MLQTTTIAMWIACIVQVNLGGDIDFPTRLAFVAASFIPCAFLSFTRAFPWPSKYPSQAFVTTVFTIAAAFSVLALASNLVVYDVHWINERPARRAGPLYPAFAVFFLAVWGVAVSVFVGKWRRARGRALVQLDYVGAGILVASLGGITTNLLIPLISGHSTYFTIGPYFAFAYVAFVGHAIIRHRLMDLRLVVHRGLTFAIATVMSLLPVAALLTLIGPRVSLHLTPTETGAAIVAIVIVALVIPITRDVANRLLDRYVYRRQANYRRIVREASRALTGVLHLKKLVRFMQGTVANAVECEGVALYLRRGGLLRRDADEWKHEEGWFDAPSKMPATMLERTELTHDVVVTEEIAHIPGAGPLYAELQALNWALVLPAISENTVIGAIVLGPKRSGDPYYPHDLDLLMTLANQAGIAIKNAQLYAQVVLANEYLENIVATMTSGVVAVDPDGVITMFNPAAEQMTGLTHAGVQGQPLASLPAVLGEAVSDALRDGVARTQLEVELSDGVTARPVICASAPLRDPDGTLLGAVAVFSDLTPVRQLEIERRRAERLAYLETFAAGIGHEVKNPLVAIKTFVQLVPRRRTDEQFVDEFSRVVSREISRMERLIERLRTLSRPGQRPHCIVDVRQPLVDALEFMQASFEEKPVVVDAALGETDAPVVGDGNELEQLFLNLLMNANEATPPGGRIGVGVTREDGRIMVSVSDSGPGIPDDELTRVFDPFYTTKERGSGLGLYICVGIADTHGARLRAENVPTGGARFTIEFPLASEVSTAVAS